MPPGRLPPAEAAIERDRIAEARLAAAEARGYARGRSEGVTALFALHEAIFDAFDGCDDCEDCGDKCEAGNDVPCRFHGSKKLWQAITAAQRAIGPCRCGHTTDEHEDMTRCRRCACSALKFPVAEPPTLEQFVQWAEAGKLDMVVTHKGRCYQHVREIPEREFEADKAFVWFSPRDDSGPDGHR